MGRHMHPLRRLLTVLAAPLSALVAMAAAPAVPVLASGSTPFEEAVRGSDGALWARTDGSGWTSLGGALLAAPAVASVPDPNDISSGTPLFIVTGTDNGLWARSLTQGWQPLSSAATSCIGNPAAVVVSAHAAGQLLLTVACQGSDNAVWSGQETVGPGQLPSQAIRFGSLGGVLSNNPVPAGPAIAPVEPLTRTVDDELTFFANGTDGHVWTRTVNTGWAQRPWGCAGHPAAGTSFSSVNPSLPEITVFACHGTDNRLWWAKDTGGGWLPARPDPLGGTPADGLGVAVGPETATFYVQGTDGMPYEETITYGGNIFGWSSPGGQARGGAAAAALLFRNANA